MANKFARQLRKKLTRAEQRLWQAIRRRQIDGHRFRRQVPFGRFVVDFACLERRLIVEVDGRDHQYTVHYDEQRTRWLEAQGYTVVRFWNFEVLEGLEIVVERIRFELRMASPPSPALPRKGGGRSRRW